MGFHQADREVALRRQGPHADPLGGRPALPGVLHGGIPVTRPALQLGEVVADLRDRARDAVRHGITQELGERPAGLVQAVGELEELRHDEARTQDVRLELALHVPFQGDPAIEQLLIDPASEEELDERICLERFGHHPWVLQLLGQVQRGASVPFRCREVSPEQPGVPEVLLDQRPQREIVPRLAPGGLEHSPGPPPTFGLGEAHPQVQQHAGPSRPGHREVHRLLQDAPRQRGIPALVVRHASLVGPMHKVLASVPRRGAAGHLPELGRGLRRSAGRGQQGGLLEGGGDGDVRALDGQRQVASSLLRIADDRREPRVQLATPGQRDLLIDGGREEGVGEPWPVAGDFHHTVLDGRTKSTVDRGRSGRPSDRVERRRRQGRDDLEGLDGLGWEPFEAVLDEFLKPFRDRGPFAGRHLAPTTQERAPDLLGEERIAARHLVEAEERGSREALTDLDAEHPCRWRRRRGNRRGRDARDPRRAPRRGPRDRRRGRSFVAAAITPTVSSLRRRTTNWSTRTEGRSIHWMSSMATTTGVLEATDRRHPRTARETARWSARAPELGARRRATSRARRCGSGRDGSASSRTGSRRSPRAAYERRVSASTGPHESVR